MRNLFTNPKRLPLIAPSILSADFADMGAECRHVLGSPPAGAGADLLHLDVMDGHFVPNLTMGPDLCRALRKALPSAFLDVHLMVEDPWFHAQAFIAAGASHITFHAEVGGSQKLREWAAGIREAGCTAGLAINPGTAPDIALELADAFDLFLVMSVNPGFSGQAFIPAVLDKTRAISEDLTPNQRLQMDGGIKADNIAAVLDAGCDVVVAASAIFGVVRERRQGVVEHLRGSTSTLGLPNKP